MPFFFLFLKQLLFSLGVRALSFVLCQGLGLGLGFLALFTFKVILGESPFLFYMDATEPAPQPAGPPVQAQEQDQPAQHSVQNPLEIPAASSTPSKSLSEPPSLTSSDWEICTQLQREGEGTSGQSPNHQPRDGEGTSGHTPSHQPRALPPQQGQVVEGSEDLKLQMDIWLSSYSSQSVHQDFSERTFQELTLNGLDTERVEKIRKIMKNLSSEEIRKSLKNPAAAGKELLKIIRAWDDIRDRDE